MEDPLLYPTPFFHCFYLCSIPLRGQTPDVLSFSSSTGGYWGYRKLNREKHQEKVSHGSDQTH